MKNDANRTVSHTPRGGGAMRNYITKALRVIILVIVLLVVFATKAK